MKTIDLTKSGLSTELKAELKKASEEYDRNDYQNAYKRFFSLYNQGTNLQGLQLSIALCLLKMNKRRQGRLLISRELLDYPDNVNAIAVLDEEVRKVNGRTIVKNFYQTEWPENHPSLSVVMIVKNEEKDLPRCLESIKDIATEIVILDTGSTDNTVEIAKSFGARVEYFEWCNDFSAARNESLKYATSDWILRMDADEYMLEIDKIRLLHCINSGKAEVYICPMISPVKNGIQVDKNVRLIKNHLGIYFTFPIHETVFFSVRELGLRTCLADNINFQHTGYAFEEEGSDDKKISRNVKVCNQYLEKHPDDYYVSLIRDLFLINGPERAVALKNMEEVIQRLPDETLAVRYLGLAYLSLVQEYVAQKNNIGLINILLDMQTDFFFDRRMVQFIGEIYLYVKGDINKAKKYFDWSSRKDSKGSDFEGALNSKQYNQAEGLCLLAETMLLTNNLDQSKNLFVKADKLRKELDKEDTLQKSKEESFSWVCKSKLTADELRSLAKELQGKGDWRNSYKCIIRAASKSQLELQDYLDMAYCQLQLNYLKFSQLLLDSAKRINPDAAMISNLEALIAIKEGNSDVAIEKAVEALVKEPGNQNFQSNVEQIAKISKMTPVEAIKKVALKWIENRNTKMGLFALVLYSKFQANDPEVIQILKKYSS